jgi:hypothetical protein
MCKIEDFTSDHIGQVCDALFVYQQLGFSLEINPKKNVSFKTKNRGKTYIIRNAILITCSKKLQTNSNNKFIRYSEMKKIFELFSVDSSIVNLLKMKIPDVAFVAVDPIFN